MKDPSGDLVEMMAAALEVSLDFFMARDDMNAAVHFPSPKRLSPVTEMVAEALSAWQKWKFDGEGATT